MVTNISRSTPPRSALSEPKAVGAQGSTKVLAVSSLGSCLVFVSSAVVTLTLAAIDGQSAFDPPTGFFRSAGGAK
jgi:hypothetical protein